jgi:hypothetical protein
MTRQEGGRKMIRIPAEQQAEVSSTHMGLIQNLEGNPKTIAPYPI